MDESQAPAQSRCPSPEDGHCQTHVKPWHSNAARERSRVRTLRTAFLQLQKSLPAVPPNTKLSKLDVLILATAYICHLTQTLKSTGRETVTSVRDWRDDADANSLKTTAGETQSEQGENGRFAAASKDIKDASASESDLTSTQRDAVNSATQISKTLSGPNVGCSCKARQKARATGRAKPSLKKRRMARLPSAGSGQERLKDADNAAKRVADLAWYHQQAIHSSANATIDLSPQTSMHPSGCTSSRAVGLWHPVKKWPMRSRLFESILGNINSATTDTTTTRKS